MIDFAFMVMHIKLMLWRNLDRRISSFDCSITIIRNGCTLGFHNNYRLSNAPIVRGFTSITLPHELQTIGTRGMS